MDPRGAPARGSSRLAKVRTTVLTSPTTSPSSPPPLSPPDLRGGPRGKTPLSRQGSRNSHWFRQPLDAQGRDFGERLLTPSSSTPQLNPPRETLSRQGGARKNSNRFRQSLDAQGRERLLPKTVSPDSTVGAPTYDPFSSPSFLASLSANSRLSTPKMAKRRGSVEQLPSDISLQKALSKPRRRSVECAPGRRRSIESRTIEIARMPSSQIAHRRAAELSEPKPDAHSSLPGEMGVAGNCPSTFSTKSSCRTFPTTVGQRRMKLQPLPGVVKGRKRSIPEIVPQRITTQQKEALKQQEQRNLDSRSAEAWQRVFRGIERDMQYADSLSTATKLPEFGQMIANNVLGNIAELRRTMSNMSTMSDMSQ